MKWDASAYDRRHGFVAEYGRALLELVPDDPALSVLDLGCGTGTLTAQLAANGRRVVGAEGNVQTISDAFARACAEQGLTVHSRFNMPSAEVFGRRLTDSGFVIDGLYAFDRPTPLSGSDGLACWMKQFFAGELAALPGDVRPAVIARAEELARPALWDGAQWIADYRRLRAVAHRP